MAAETLIFAPAGATEAAKAAFSRSSSVCFKSRSSRVETIESEGLATKSC